MQFRVLGPVAAIRDGSEIDLGPPKQRSLLALLLIHANEVVSTDRIVEALWDEPPRTAASVVQVYVSGLRGTLEPDRAKGSSPSVLITERPGYLLRVADDDLDAARFAHAVADARTRNPDVAAGMLEEALRLWLGRPFDDVAYAEFAQSEIRRLGLLRERAEEMLNDAWLELGESDRVLGRVEAQIDERPLSEPLWRHYMLALYRSGRQADALRAYRRACEAMAEVGTEPSTNLAELEAQILLRDRRLDPSPIDDVRPSNLPRYLSTFVGREGEEARLHDLLASHRLVTLVGPGGIGKTRLAAEAAWRIADARIQDLWFVDFTGAEPGDPIAPRVIAAVGVPTGVDVRSDLETLVDHFGSRRVLLVLDNCEHLVQSVSTFIHDVLTSAPGVRVLATSRQPLGVEGEVVTRIGPLPLESDRYESAHALQLFHDRATHANSELDISGLDDGLVESLLQSTAGMPLAIELAASRMGTMSLEQLAHLVATDTDVLRIEDRGHDRHAAMSRTVDWSYRLLSLEAQAGFRRLSVFRGGFTLALATPYLARLGGDELSESKTLEIVTELTSASMVTLGPTGRYSLLEPIRQYAARTLWDAGEAAEARAAHAELFRESFAVPDFVLFHCDPHLPEMPAQLAAEIDNVAFAVAWLLDHDPPSAIALTSVAGSAVIDERGIGEALRWYRRALNVSGRATADRARTLTGAIFAALYSSGNEEAQGYVDELFSVAESLDQERWRCAALVRASDLAAVRGDEELAYRLTLEAAERLEAIEHPETFIVLNNRTTTSLAAGWFDRAEMIADRLVSVGETLGPAWAPSVGGVYRAAVSAFQGDVEASRHRLVRAFAAAQPEDGHSTLIGDTELITEAHIAILEDRPGSAAEHAWELVAATRAVGEPHGLIEGLILLGVIAIHEGDARVASRYLFEALSLTERLGHRWLQHEPLALLATTLLPHDPVLGTEILGSLEAERRRDRRVLRAIVAEVIDSAWADLAEHQDPHEIDAARRRGERMPFEEALERGCDAARVALHRSRRSDSDEGRATAVDAVGLMSSGG